MLLLHTSKTLPFFNRTMRSSESFLALSSSSNFMSIRENKMRQVFNLVLTRRATALKALRRNVFAVPLRTLGDVEMTGFDISQRPSPALSRAAESSDGSVKLV
jgi:hypothetical protein